MGFLICEGLTLARLLILLLHVCVGSQAMGIHWGPEANKQPNLLHGTATESNSPGVAEEKQARELIGAWCSAYSDLNAKQMADLETAGVEVVDGFGDEHYFMSGNDRERFWDDGFQMIEAQEFHPQCVFQHIRLLHPGVAIVQATVSHSHGIKLKGGERIPPYSEIHTFVVAKNEETWLIAAHNFTRQVLPTTLFRLGASSFTRFACRLRAALNSVAGNVEVDAQSRKIEEVQVWALHQEIHDPIYRIDPSTYACSDGVRFVEP